MRQLAPILLYVGLWSSGFIPSRVLVREMSPLWALVIRLAVAGVLLLGIMVAMRLPRPRSTQWRAVVAIGILTNVVYLGLIYAALQHLSAGMAAIIASTNPLLLALVAPRMVGERMTRSKVVGLCLGFGGVAFLMSSRAGSPTERPVDAALAMIGVCGLVGSAVVYKRAAFPPRALVGVTACQLLVGAVVVLPLAAALEGRLVLPTTDAAWAAMTYLIVIMSVGASLLWFWLLTRNDITSVSAFYFLVPVLGLALSHFTLGERLLVRDVACGIAIAAGIALAQRAGRGQLVAVRE